MNFEKNTVGTIEVATARIPRWQPRIIITKPNAMDPSRIVCIKKCLRKKFSNEPYKSKKNAHLQRYLGAFFIILDELGRVSNCCQFSPPKLQRIFDKNSADNVKCKKNKCPPSCQLGLKIIHPTQKFVSMNLLQVSCVITWS